MEIREARQLIADAFGEFLVNEAPKSQRALIILKQMEALGYGVVILLNGSYKVTINKDVMGAIIRHQKKQAKRRKKILKYLNRDLE